MKNKILYVFDRNDLDSRLPVALAAQKEGFDVVLAVIGPIIHDPVLEKFEVRTIAPPVGKFGVRAGLKLAFAIKKTVAKVKPDLLHTVTLKYAFVCGLATLSYKDMKRLYTLAGLGYIFRGTGSKSSLLRAALGPLLCRILTDPQTHLIFQNPDDRALMIETGNAVVTRSSLIRGSGVDLKKFKPKAEPKNKLPVVLMPTRLVKEKGIRVFIEAAQILRARGIEAKFQIAGGEPHQNPQAISKEEMIRWTEDGTVEWLGRVKDMPGLLAGANLIVYPSYYGEGIPRVLLEACAAGRAIVTTDNPGCKEAVVNNKNGFLVPVKNPGATAIAIEVLLTDPEKRAAMGMAGRQKAEKEFDITVIAKETAKTYKKVLVS